MEIFIEDDYRGRHCNIYLRVVKGGSKSLYLNYDGEKLVEQEVDEFSVSTEVKPLLSITRDIKEALMNAFINEGAKINLRTENENLLKGKLEATLLHLDDMRQISKKLLDNEIQKVKA